MSRQHRSAFAKFRCGVAPLRIETGRYENIPLENRVCFNCKDLVEDETHALLICPLYNDERKHILEICLNFYPDFNMLCDSTKFNLLLESPKLIFYTASTCYSILCKRRAILYV